MAETRSDVAIVGAGVIGLAHAWAAAKRGMSVALFERHSQAAGASVRNFGMVWPVGQPEGPLRDLALRSRQCWLELADDAGLWINPCGSLHLVYRDDERAVVQEFVNSETGVALNATWLDPDAVLERTPAARPDGLHGAMASESELCVNPRSTMARMPGWLSERYGVDARFGAQVVDVEADRVATVDGRAHRADRVFVCGGHDTRTLFPEWFEQQGLYECKLQMMRTVPQPNGWRLGPHLAGGLTLQHYSSFNACASLPNLKERIEKETPELNRFGIHVMASQNDEGHVILGDSHEYGHQAEPFDKSEIDDLILRELRKMVDLPDWSIQSRWHGVYAKHAAYTVLQEEVEGVGLVLIPGGAGMTLSMGLADRNVADEFASWRV